MLNCYTLFTFTFFTLSTAVWTTVLLCSMFNFAALLTGGKEASILWSHHEETRELPGERDNASNNARCTRARKTTHGLDGQHQYVIVDYPWKSQSE